MAVYESGAGELGRGIMLDNGHILRVFAGGTIVIFSLREIDEERFGSLTSTIEAISFAAANDTAPGATQEARAPAHDNPANETPAESGPFEFITPDQLGGDSLLLGPCRTDDAQDGLNGGESLGGGAQAKLGLNSSISENQIFCTAAKIVTVRCDSVDFVFCATPDGEAASKESLPALSLSDGTTITILDAPTPDGATTR